jgi:hypothetical protein
MDSRIEPRRVFRRRGTLLFAIVLLILGLSQTPGFAAAVVQTGTDGANGTPGVNGGDGGAGQPGGDATAPVATADPSNSATADAGEGGDGGAGGNTATAGARGGDGGNGGAGGDANASATTPSSAATVSATAIALGGHGGDGGNGGSGPAGIGAGGQAGAGGAAHAGASAANSLPGGNTNVFARVQGGNGGNGGNATMSGGQAGGPGGLVSLGPVAGAAIDGTVIVTAQVNGGAGGNGATGGDGANAALADVVEGTTAGLLRLQQAAFGGAAGHGQAGAPGVAGDAQSSLSAFNPGGGPLEGTSTAVGGIGGNATGSALPGSGGHATASIALSSSTNTVFAVSNATGQVGGTNLNSGQTGMRGVGTAAAHATTSGGFRSHALANATGQLPIAIAVSDTSGGAISAMWLTGTTTNQPAVSAETIAAIGGGFSTSATNANSLVRSYGLPTAADVNSQLVSDPNVTAAYNAPGGHTPLALVAMNLDAANTMTGGATFGVTANYSFDVNMLTGGKLLVGLLDPASGGPGFTSLQFTIQREGATVVNETFATLAAATAYFNDRPLDLGPVKTNVVDTLDLSISLTMVSPDNNTSFFASLLVADVGPPMLPGDYNNNGVVDAADYVLWRKHRGTNTALPNDPIGGTIGTAHYNTWRTNFGSMAGSGSSLAAVPEPAAFLSLLLALVNVLAGHRCRCY